MVVVDRLGVADLYHYGVGVVCMVRSGQPWGAAHAAVARCGALFACLCLGFGRDVGGCRCWCWC